MAADKEPPTPSRHGFVDDVNNQYFYHVIHFEFKEDGSPQFMAEVPDTPLQLRQANTNKDVTITYKSVFNLYKMLEHYKAPAESDTQKLLQDAIVWVKHQSGWHKLILQETTILLPRVEARWIPSLHEYLGKTGMKIKLKYNEVYPCQRINDRHIMTSAIHSSSFSLLELRKLNDCRVYLGVTMLSDITLADGSTLDPHMRSGNIPLYSSSTTQLKAKQAQPNKSSWKIWSKCLKLFAQSDQLKIPLTKWLIPTPQQKFKWPTYIVPEQGCIYVRQVTAVSRPHHPALTSRPHLLTYT
eukprot:15340168-Ditylum_brightwellii.AAC.1